MTCQELDRLLYPYLDGEFQPEERVDMETHLAVCADCTRRVEEEREIQQALRRAARHSIQASRAPASLRAGIQLGLRQEQRRASQFQILKMGAAALVVVAVGGAWVALRTEERQRRVDAIVKRHKMTLPYDLTNATPEQIEQWLLTQKAPPVPLPRFPKTRPDGVRLSHDAVSVSYETEPEKEGESVRRITLLAMDDPRGELSAQESPSVQVDSSNRYSVVVWRDGEVVYNLVGDLSESDIIKLVQQREPSSRVANAPRPVAPGLAVPVQPVVSQSP
jgi:anti-sigma factor RsiW